MEHELDVVGGLYRTNPDGTVAVAFDNGSGLPRKVNEVDFVMEDEPVEVWGIGFGFVLMKHGVFEKMDRPWFEIEKIRWPEHSFDTNVGEDYSWCMRARRAGFKVMVDPKVKVGHTKETIYQVR
jgi:GT2 family glycosyltransferase